VDSHHDCADSLALVLSLWGYDIRVAYSGTEALEIARAYRPCLVVTEILLPGIDGHELANCLRAEPEPAVLIALTSLGREVDRLRSRMAGFDHHVVKPVDLDALRKLLALAGYFRRARLTLSKPACF